MRKHKPKIIWEPAAITYGTPLGPRQLNARAFHEDKAVLGRFEYFHERGARLPAGEHTLTAIFEPKNTRSFRTVEATAQLVCNKATLAASIVGTPTKAYDGNNIATLTLDNFALSGLKYGDIFTVMPTEGIYDSPNANEARRVTATLSECNFVPSGNASRENYNLPDNATGPGQVSPAALTISIVNIPTKTYDGTVSVALTPSNFNLAGLVGLENFVVSQMNGSYDYPDVKSATTVTVDLQSSELTPNGSAMLSNYEFSSSASGEGRITPAIPIMNVSGGTLAALGIDGPVAGRYALTGPEGSRPLHATVTFSSADSNYADVAASGIVITAPQPRYITGRVENSSGAGVAGYRVRLLDVLTNQVVEETRTDSEGNYKIPYGAAGSYKVLAGDTQVEVGNVV